MGYDNFGLKIGVEGEREFLNSIREINSSFKKCFLFLIY